MRWPISSRAGRRRPAHIRNDLLNSGWFPLVDLLFALIAGILWYWGQGQLTWQPLLVALLPWAFRLAAGRFPFRRTPFDILLVIFVLMAVVGVWAAYNRESAWIKFWLIVGAVFLFYALAGQPPENLWLIVTLLGLAGVLLAGFFLMAHDWRTAPSEFGILNRIAFWWMSIRPVQADTRLNPNVVGSLLAMTMPFLLALGLHANQRRYRVAFWLSIVATGFVALSLLLTSSRGAWLALMAAIGIWAIWWLGGKVSGTFHLPRRKAFAILLVLTLGSTILIGFLWPQGPVDLLNSLPGRASASDRLMLFKSTFDLIADYSFTGGGLDSFAGLYSQYILVIPTLFLQNGHNILLDSALEQGVLGFVALAGILLGSFWFLIHPGRSTTNGDAAASDLQLVRWAIAASLVVMVVHGLVEDTVYGSPAVLFLFLLPGLTMAVAQPDTGLFAGSSQLLGQAPAVILVLLLAAIVLLALFGRQLTAALYANLGAVEMARSELTAWPTNQWDDGSNVAALHPAEELFRKSLESDPANRTAHHRLGLTSILRRDFDRAVAHLETAAGVTPRHQGIRKALAYSYVWSGQFDQARELMAEIPEAGQEMQVYSWWWTTQDRDDLAARAGQMVVELEGAGNRE